MRWLSKSILHDFLSMSTVECCVKENHDFGYQIWKGINGIFTANDTKNAHQHMFSVILSNVYSCNMIKLVVPHSININKMLMNMIIELINVYINSK